MSGTIPPTKKALEEALALSAEILENIELSQLPLANIALKASRLARLLNEDDMQKIMAYEASGYPSTPEGIQPETWKLAVIAGRNYKEKTLLNETEVKEYIYTSPISDLEHEIQISQAALEAAKDRDVALSSANPYQTVNVPYGNYLERQSIKSKSQLAVQRLASRKSLIYNYALQKHYDLKFSGIADDIFSRIREHVDKSIGSTVPNAVQKLSAAYDNLQSENPEDWSNAVHSCRRILQDLADAVCPPSKDKEKPIKLGAENYINRIMCFVESRSSSKRFNEIVGSHLKYLGERLDSIFEATQKGSHTTIVKREEADRYLIYTYMLVGDILSL